MESPGQFSAAINSMADWSMTSLQLQLIKIVACIVRHARAITFQLAEAPVTSPMVRANLAAVHRLRARHHVRDSDPHPDGTKASGQACPRR